MKVFISSASADSGIARKVSMSLEKEGIDSWSGNELIFPGDNWAEAVSKALRDSDAMVVIASPNTMNSRNVRDEISYALGSRKYENKIFPLVVSDNESKASYDYLPWILRDRMSISLPNQPQEQEKGLMRLVERLKEIEKEPSSGSLIDVHSDAGK